MNGHMNVKFKPTHLSTAYHVLSVLNNYRHDDNPKLHFIPKRLNIYQIQPYKQMLHRNTVQ